jgi:hypothetical protein
VAFIAKDFSDHLIMAVLSCEAINEAYSDHTRLDVVMQAHVVTKQVSTPIPATVVAFPDSLA